MQLTVSAYAIEPSFIMMGTAGSYGIEELIFDFSTEWDDLTKIVSFFPADRSERVDVYLTEDACQVPREFTAHSGIAVMTIQGIKDGVSRLTITTDVGITATMPPATNPPLPPSPTLVEQLIAIAQEADAAAQSVRDDADAGVFDGKPAYPVTNVSSAAEVTAVQNAIASGEYSADTAYAFVSTAFSTYTVGDMLSITENDVSVLFHISGTSVDVDQHYDPTSENAQSGIAVSEAFPTETEVETIWNSI